MSRPLKTKHLPRHRDGEATKAAILDAAELEFARAGLLGARTENIAEPSGVTRAMIHYYYDSKEKLYQAVLERCFSQRIFSNSSIDLETAPVEVALEQFLRDFLRECCAHPHMPTIILFESIQNKGIFYKDFAMRTSYGPLVQLFERGMANGAFRIMDPLQAAINTIGMCIFYLTAKNNLQYLFPPGVDLLSAEIFQAHTEEVVAMVLNGVRALPGQ